MADRYSELIALQEDLAQCEEKAHRQILSGYSGPAGELRAQADRLELQQQKYRNAHPGMPSGWLRPDSPIPPEVPLSDLSDVRKYRERETRIAEIARIYWRDQDGSNLREAGLAAAELPQHQMRENRQSIRFQLKAQADFRRKAFAAFANVTEDQLKHWWGRRKKAHKDGGPVDEKIRNAAARWLRGER